MGLRRGPAFSLSVGAFLIYLFWLQLSDGRRMEGMRSVEYFLPTATGLVFFSEGGV